MQTERATGILQIGNLRISPRFIAVSSLLTICGILVAGMWPFYPRKNEVVWLRSENGIRLGKHGTVISAEALTIDHGEGRPCSLELWVKAAKLWTTGSVLAVYHPETAEVFSILQDYTDLVLQIQQEYRSGQTNQKQIRVKDVFRRQTGVFVTVTSDGKDTYIYVDGHVATKVTDFGLFAKGLSGQLILANAPLRNHSWSGEVKGLAFYANQLAANQVEKNYVSWTHSGKWMAGDSEDPVAVYLFRERTGGVIHSAIRNGPDLQTPERFLVVDQLLFESPTTEYMDESYLKDVLINIAGFVPLGFILACYFSAVRNARRATFAALVTGMIVSLAIEYVQSYLPTRYSGVTDIITNTLGTWIGAMLYRGTGRLVVNVTRPF